MYKRKSVKSDVEKTAIKYAWKETLLYHTIPIII